MKLNLHIICISIYWGSLRIMSDFLISYFAFPSTFSTVEIFYFCKQKKSNYDSVFLKRTHPEARASQRPLTATIFSACLREM